MKFYIVCTECGKSNKKKVVFIGDDEIHLMDDRPCLPCLAKAVILEDYRICEFCGIRTFIDILECRGCGGIMVML